MPKIVFIDEGSVNLGDLDLSSFSKHGDYVSYSSSADSEIISRSKNADILITNKCVFTKKIFKKLPRLKLLCVAATGVNNIDLGYAQKHSIAVTNVAGYSTQTVAEHTLLFLLALSHKFFVHHKASVSGLWSASPHFAWLDAPFSNLSQKTLGIIGYGKIGKKVEQLAKAFGMKILIARLPGRLYSATEKRVALKEVFQKSDFVTLHCALASQTRHLVNKKSLSWMKPEASLLNLSRGPAVDEKAVVSALLQNRLAGFATDVTSQEPPPKNHPFFDKRLQDKIIITPHIAWASLEARQKLVDEMAKNIGAFLKDEKRNRVV